MSGTIAIACAGVHAGVLIETLAGVSDAPVVLFDDDPAAGGQTRFGARVAGTIADIATWAREGKIVSAMIGTANVRRLDVRRRMFELLEELHLPLATAVHRQAFVATSAEIGAGSFLGPMAVVHSRTTIGRTVCIYTASTIDHDSRVEDHVFIAPGVHTAGQVTIESGAYLGPGSIIGSGCRVGRDSIIGAGAVVLSDIPPRSVAFGTPAVVVKSIDDWLAAR